jgi:hypothetical protein
LFEGLHGLVREDAPAGIREHAHGAAEDAQIEEGFERAQWVRVELAAVIDARHARADDEIIRQEFVPEIDDFARLREEAVAANVEAIAFMDDGAADAADILRVLLGDENAHVLLGEKIAGGQASWPRADNGDVHGRTRVHLRHLRIPEFCQRGFLPVHRKWQSKRYR